MSETSIIEVEPGKVIDLDGRRSTSAAGGVYDIGDLTRADRKRVLATPGVHPVRIAASLAEDRKQTPAVANRPAPREKATRSDDSTALPPGYTKSGGQGGYWTVKDGARKAVPGPSNGKWQGEDGAADGAWNHYSTDDGGQ